MQNINKPLFINEASGEESAVVGVKCRGTSKGVHCQLSLASSLHRPYGPI
jgi:hypothetical protein|nr:hypothetical protein [Halomonas sp. Ant2]|tara:strand:- start:3604 stop:3753 length:150 start_codon:yes stop_codon:yes gene_type:complete